MISRQRKQDKAKCPMCECTRMVLSFFLFFLFFLSFFLSFFCFCLLNIHPPSLTCACAQAGQKDTIFFHNFFFCKDDLQNALPGARMHGLPNTMSRARVLLTFSHCFWFPNPTHSLPIGAVRNSWSVRTCS